MWSLFSQIPVYRHFIPCNSASGCVSWCRVSILELQGLLQKRPGQIQPFEPGCDGGRYRQEVGAHLGEEVTGEPEGRSWRVSIHSEDNSRTAASAIVPRGTHFRVQKN